VRGTIPLAIGAVSRAAVERAARIGDGLTLAFRTWDDFREQLAWYRDAGGRGAVILRGGPMLADAEHPTPPQTWTEGPIVENLGVVAEEGVTEFVWDLNIAGYEPARQVELMEALASALGVGVGAPGAEPG
jgi:alkanesulfonate monooxygenase SsuD/methylene tetrahydromethanopterin reductase-like flavin-dependent oxidoreductase (luciferase family)